MPKPRGTAEDRTATRGTGLCVCVPPPAPQSPCKTAFPLRNWQSSFGIAPGPLKVGCRGAPGAGRGRKGCVWVPRSCCAPAPLHPTGKGGRRGCPEAAAAPGRDPLELAGGQDAVQSPPPPQERPVQHRTAAAAPGSAPGPGPPRAPAGTRGWSIAGGTAASRGTETRGDPAPPGGVPHAGGGVPRSGRGPVHPGRGPAS